jgi:very-short-patch-repair endonuclease
MRSPKPTMQFAKTLRSELTPPEVWLWRRLKALRAQGVRVRRQHPIGRYVLDFYCPAAKLAIEIDGYSHVMGDRPTHDERRDAWLRSQGIEVMRIPAVEVLRNPDEVADWLAQRLLNGPPQSPCG